MTEKTKKTFLSIISALVIVVAGKYLIQEFSGSQNSLDDQLFAAVEKQDSQKVNDLLHKGANANAKSKMGSSVLIRAILIGNLNIVKDLVEHKADLNYSNNAATPLLLAVAHGKKEIVKFLLSQKTLKIDFSPQDAKGATALFAAVLLKDFEMIQLLVAAKADVNHKNILEVTPLMLAVNEKSDDQTLSYLIKNGAKVNLRNNQGHTALMYAANSNQLSALKLLLKEGAEVNVQDSQEITALMLASYNGNEEAVKALLASGANPKLKDQKGNTALEYALTQKQENIAKILQNHKALKK